MSAAYRRTWRRTLLDMHIPDWDAGFLADLDPKAIVAAYEAAGVGGVMLYCKSHVGLCYWPTAIGSRHKTAAVEDFVGQTTTLLAERDIPVCAYYSIVYDNEAATGHPDWAMRTADGHTLQELLRYGWCCINNTGYRAYEIALMSELLRSYEFSALFLDMIFWPIVCYCDNCKQRWASEGGGDEIPRVVDWTDPAWCSFQQARDRWSREWAHELAGTARTVVPGIEVTHNLAPSLTDWRTGQTPLAADADDFVAGDLYGDMAHELTAAKLMLHLSKQQPPEFMTSVCVNLGDHTQLKSETELRGQALGAVASGAAFAAIDAIDPVGRINAAVYERVGTAFRDIEEFEPFLGGTPLESVAVYYSVDSRIDLTQNGKPADPDVPQPYPHLDAIVGVCRNLQRAHLPFGVITQQDLGRLSDYAVVVIPDAPRMSEREAAAVRAYVEGGGAVYASRDTSLYDSAGAARSDFLLADLFGVTFTGDEPGSVLYVTPQTAWGLTAVAPQEHISLRPVGSALSSGWSPRRLPAVRATSAETVALVSEPFGYPDPGTVADRRWASIHSSPPWRTTERPALVVNQVGAGRISYCVADLETHEAEASRALFQSAIRHLLRADPLPADLPDDVWLSVFDQPDRRTCTLFRESGHERTWTGEVTLPLPTARRFVSASLVGDGALDATESDGRVRCRVTAASRLVIVVLDLA